MALTHVTRLFSVNDAAVYKLTADSAGVNPTYAAKVDVPGVQSLTSTVDMDIKELRGDNALLAVDTVFKDVKGKLTYGKFSFDVLAAMTTAAAADSGTTPTQKTTITLGQFDLPSNWKLEAQSKQEDVTGGDIHMLYWRCIMASADMFGFAQDDYNGQGTDYQAMPLLGTPTGFPANSWVSAILNETAVAIV